MTTTNYHVRGVQAWKTRVAGLKAQGLIKADGEPTRKLAKLRTEQAVRAWETRRANEAARIAAERKAARKVKADARKAVERKANATAARKYKARRATGAATFA